MEDIQGNDLDTSIYDDERILVVVIEDFLVDVYIARYLAVLNFKIAMLSDVVQK